MMPAKRGRCVGIGEKITADMGVLNQLSMSRTIQFFPPTTVHVSQAESRTFQQFVKGRKATTNMNSLLDEALDQQIWTNLSKTMRNVA
jgi:hypothetical protein